MVLGLVLGMILGPRAIAQTTLVSTGAVWKYLSDGSDPGAGWAAGGFDDQAWPSGAAELGFGENDEATVIGNATNGFIAFYFRHAFDVAQPEAVSNLFVSLKRDDGAIVYLNGTEVFRSHLGPGPVNHLTRAPYAAPDDGKSLFTNGVPVSLLLTGANLLAVEVHQNATNSSDISFDLTLLANLEEAPAPPVLACAIATPTNAAVVASRRVTLVATASATNTTPVLVEFFANGTRVGDDFAPPYSDVWTNAPPGIHLLTAVAYDGQGYSATSAPVVLTVLPPPPALIPIGSEWSYLDDGSDQGTTWTSPSFDDSGWATGQAELGYGDGDETTIVAGGPSTNRFITTYFRHHFFVDDLAPITNVIVRLLRDDGGICYINGVEIFRSNMPTGMVSYLTRARDIAEDDTYHATNIDLTLLQPGENVMAVEIHQVNGTSSDLSFNLELRTNIPPTAPEIMLTSPSNGLALFGPTNVTITAQAFDLDDPIAEVEFFANTNSVGVDLIYPYSADALNLPPGEYALTAVAVDTFNLRTTSAPVFISVLAAPFVSTLVATGSVWRFWDAGTDLGTGWQAAGFDDSAWKQGPAPLGFGDGDEATLVTSNRQITTYFRHAFSVPAGTFYTNLAFRLVRDDGAVVYLNGTELFRMNMPSNNPVLFNTRASTAVGGAAESTFYPTNISPAALLAGPNLLAVEIHQDSPTSSDISLELELHGIGLPQSAGPLLAFQLDPNDSTKLILTWTDLTAILEEAPAVDGPWTDVAGNPVGTYCAITTGPDRFFRLRK
jgi:hypothetical protein